MVLARLLSFDRADDLALGAARLGVPPAGVEGLGHRVVLLTGLSAGLLEWIQPLPASGTAKPAHLAAVVGRRPGSAVLAASRAGLTALADRARAASHLTLADALSRLDLYESRPPSLTLGARRFDWGVRTWVMGVVNVTPDSFSDGGRYLDAAAAIEHGRRLVEAGADLLDVGGESTRPGADAVSEGEELRRVLPVLEGLARAAPGVPLSIDTSKPGVARRAVAAGATLVNDVTGFRDEALVRAVADSGAAACLMHMHGTPRTMQQSPSYEDAVEEILAALQAGVDRAVSLGIPRARLLVDPGIGFGKTPAHNLFLLRRLADFRLLGLPVLVGTSRKSFLGTVTGGKPAPERVVASAASAAVVAVLRGADVVRVHDVAETRDALAVAEAVRSATDGGSAFRAAQEGV